MATNMMAVSSLNSKKPDKLRLGDVLLKQRIISNEQLEWALSQQSLTGKKLGRLLIDSGALTEDLLADTVAKQLRIPFINLKFFNFKQDVVKLLPEAYARRFRAMVLEDQRDSLLVAMADPLDLFAYDELTRILKRDISLATVSESQLLAAFDRFYRRTEEISGLARVLEQDISETVDFGSLSENAGKEDAPVVRLLQTVFEDAAQIRASDIHIEPQNDALHIRFRIDGVLQPQAVAEKRIAGALAQRLKLMATLDISERRLPQDGRFSVRVNERLIDVRLSTLPGQYGESVVLRLLNQGGVVPRLNAIGMPQRMYERFRTILNRVTGMVLVTGPTGSGKTTTLYAAISEVEASTYKIITIEDPIEFRLPGLTQVQVNDKISLDFARVLRATLRQDPDVILVGEMRDTETAEIGMRAAITGHMVLSTLHTRDAINTPLRLLDMGIPPYMVATALQAVIAQRLVRLNCESCTEPYTPNQQEANWLATFQEAISDGMSVSRGRGCTVCNGTGFSGRTGVYEMFEMDEALARAASQGDIIAFRDLGQRQMLGHTFVDHAVELVRHGRISVSEAIRVSNISDG